MIRFQHELKKKIHNAMMKAKICTQKILDFSATNISEGIKPSTEKDEKKKTRKGRKIKKKRSAQG